MHLTEYEILLMFMHIEKTEDSCCLISVFWWWADWPCFFSGPQSITDYNTVHTVLHLCISLSIYLPFFHVTAIMSKTIRWICYILFGFGIQYVVVYEFLISCHKSSQKKVSVMLYNMFCHLTMFNGSLPLLCSCYLLQSSTWIIIW